MPKILSAKQAAKLLGISQVDFRTYAKLKMIKAEQNGYHCTWRVKREDAIAFGEEVLKPQRLGKYSKDKYEPEHIEDKKDGNLTQPEEAGKVIERELDRIEEKKNEDTEIPTMKFDNLQPESIDHNDDGGGKDIYIGKSYDFVVFRQRNGVKTKMTKTSLHLVWDGARQIKDLLRRVYGYGKYTLMVFDPTKTGSGTKVAEKSYNLYNGEEYFMEETHAVQPMSRHEQEKHCIECILMLSKVKGRKHPVDEYIDKYYTRLEGLLEYDSLKGV